jgi:peroxiredoxin
MMKVETGQEAPDFSLYDTERNKVTLSELKEKTSCCFFSLSHSRVFAPKNFAG